MLEKLTEFTVSSITSGSFEISALPVYVHTRRNDLLLL